MSESFKKYLGDLYKDVPTEVYEGLLSIFCIVSIVLIVLLGWKNGWKKIVCLLFAEYMVLIFYSTVICRKYVAEAGHNFHPFWSYEAMQQGRENLIAENLMNVVVFIPVGLFLGIDFRTMTWWKVMIIGLCFSLSIETMQFLLKRGFSEVDDVIHNTLGCLIGLLIIALIERLWLLLKRY